MTTQHLVLITRPHEDLEKTVKYFESRGFKTLCAPLLNINFHAKPDLSNYQTILITSINALRALGPGEYPQKLITLTQTSAHEAQNLGWQNIDVVEGTAQDLVTYVKTTSPPRPVLYLRGKDIRYPIAKELSCNDMIMYDAKEADCFPQEILDQWDSITHIAVYSPRTAKVLGRLCKTHRLKTLSKTILGLSNSILTAMKDQNLLWHTYELLDILPLRKETPMTNHPKDRSTWLKYISIALTSASLTTLAGGIIFQQYDAQKPSIPNYDADIQRLETAIKTFQNAPSTSETALAPDLTSLETRLQRLENTPPPASPLSHAALALLTTYELEIAQLQGKPLEPCLERLKRLGYPIPLSPEEPWGGPQWLKPLSNWIQINKTTNTQLKQKLDTLRITLWKDIAP